MKYFTVESTPAESTISVHNDDDTVEYAITVRGEIDGKLREALSGIEHSLATALNDAENHPATAPQEKGRLCLVAWDLRQVVIEETLKAEGWML